MPTYLDCVNRIQDEILNRTTLTNAVKSAINSAIRLRQRERYWFNQTSTALATVASTQTIVIPSDMLQLDRLEVYTNGSSLPMQERPFGYIRQVNIDATPTGFPAFFCERSERFWLAPIPDSAYAVTAYYLQQFPALAADTDTNGWLSAAEDVIVYGAAKKVWSTTIRNLSAAAVCAQLEMEAVSELRRARDQRLNMRLTPTRW